MMRGRLPSKRGDPLDHLPVGHHLRPAGVERLADRRLVPGHPGEIARDVVERDRLRRRAHPARRDHHRQPLDEAEDRLERSAALPDHHRRAKRRHRHAVRGEVLAGLATAAQVRGRIGVVAAQAAEVDDLPHTRIVSPHARRFAPPPGPAARSRARRASGRGSRRHPLPRVQPRRRRRRRHRPRPTRFPPRPHAAPREAATTSCSPASSGRSAWPMTPVAPKTVALMPRAPARGARSSGGSRRRGTGSGPSRRARLSTTARRPVAASRGRYSSTVTLSSNSPSTARWASVTEPPGRRASSPPSIGYRHETDVAVDGNRRRPEREQIGAAEQPQAAAVGAPGRPDDAAREAGDGLPVRDAEPAGAGVGRLDRRLGHEHPLPGLEATRFEQALARLPVSERMFAHLWTKGRQRLKRPREKAA